MKRILLIILFLGNFILNANPLLMLGDREGNGGDWVTAEFISRSYTTLSYLRLKKENNIHDLDLQQFLNLLQNFDVRVSTEPLYDKNGKLVEALNYLPEEKKIVLHKQSWLDHLTSDRNIFMLIYHELLPNFNIDDQNYSKSKELLERIPDLAEWRPIPHESLNLKIGKYYGRFFDEKIQFFPFNDIILEVNEILEISPDQVIGNLTILDPDFGEVGFCTARNQVLGELRINKFFQMFSIEKKCDIVNLPLESPMYINLKAHRVNNRIQGYLSTSITEKNFFDNRYSSAGPVVFYRFSPKK